MKILILYPDFEQSAKSLDNGSLIEQVKETYNALLILLRFPEMREPWLLEWEPYIPSLAFYCLELCKEAIHRQLACPEHDRLLELIRTSGISFQNRQEPPMLHNPDYHNASREELIKKVSFEYVRANGALKVHDELKLTRQEAERTLDKAKSNYYWYDQFEWRKS